MDDLRALVRDMRDEADLCANDGVDELAQLLNAAADALEAAERDAARLQIERDHNRAQYEHAIKILVGIHNACSPPHFNLPDGRTAEFVNPEIEHTMLHALSERIRAIPDEIAAIDAARAAIGGDRG